MARGFGASENRSILSRLLGGASEQVVERPRAALNKLQKGMEAAYKRLEELKGSGRVFDIDKALYEFEKLGLDLYRYRRLQKGFGAKEDGLKDIVKESGKMYDKWKRNTDKVSDALAAEMGVGVAEGREIGLASVSYGVEAFDKKFGDAGKSSYRLAQMFNALSDAPKESGRRLAETFGSKTDELRRAVDDGSFSSKGGMTLDKAYEKVAKVVNELPSNMANPRRAMMGALAELNAELAKGGVSPRARSVLLGRATVATDMYVSALDKAGRAKHLADAGYEAY